LAELIFSRAAKSVSTEPSFFGQSSECRLVPVSEPLDAEAVAAQIATAAKRP